MARNTRKAITDAKVSPGDDNTARTVKYLISMSTRLVCFFLAIITPSPWRWIFAAGAIVLPWVAVMIANQVGDRRPPANSALVDESLAAGLGSGPSAEASPGGADDAGSTSGGGSSGSGSPDSTDGTRDTGQPGAGSAVVPGTGIERHPGSGRFDRPDIVVGYVVDSHGDTRREPTSPTATRLGDTHHVARNASEDHSAD